MYARMGMVLYPIDMDQIKLSYDYSSLVRNLRDSSCLVLNLPIGAVEPLPSREGLTYDARTISNIKEAYGEYRNLYRKQLAERISSQTTPLDAYNEIIKIRNTLGIDMLGDGVHVNGWPVNDQAQPYVFPTFIHEYEYIPPPVKDAQGVLLPDQPKSELRRVRQSQFIYEIFESNDLRLNIKRDLGEFDGMRYNFMNSILDGHYRFLLMDELEPKHRISRMKSVLNTLTRYQKYFVVKVNPNYPGSKTDFTDFHKSLEGFHKGSSSKDIKLFSQVEKPEFKKGERRTKDADALLDGVTMIKPTYFSTHEDSVRPSILDDLSTKLDFEGKAFYVKLHRNDLVDYNGVKLENFKNFIKETDMYMFFVRAGGVNKIDFLEEEYGIKEFKVCINEQLKDAQTSDAYKKHSSCVELTEKCSDWFSVNPIIQIRELIKDLRADLHPIPRFFELWEEILAVKNSKITIDPATKILNGVKDSGLFNIFADYPWAKSAAIDISADFLAAEKQFNLLYPLIHYLIKSDSSYRRNEELCKARYQYMVDYNHLANLIAAPIVRNQNP
jgi:hypothetical protein